MEEGLTIRVDIQCDFGEYPPRSFTGYYNGGPGLHEVLGCLAESVMMLRGSVPRLILTDMAKVVEIMDVVSGILLLQHLLPSTVPESLKLGRTALKISDVNIGYVELSDLSR